MVLLYILPYTRIAPVLLRLIPLDSYRLSPSATPVLADNSHCSHCSICQHLSPHRYRLRHRYHHYRCPISFHHLRVRKALPSRRHNFYRQLQSPTHPQRESGSRWGVLSPISDRVSAGRILTTSITIDRVINTAIKPLYSPTEIIAQTSFLKESGLPSPADLHVPAAPAALYMHSPFGSSRCLAAVTGSIIRKCPVSSFTFSTTDCLLTVCATLCLGPCFNYRQNRSRNLRRTQAREELCPKCSGSPALPHRPAVPTR